MTTYNKIYSNTLERYSNGDPAQWFRAEPNMTVTYDDQTGVLTVKRDVKLVYYSSGFSDMYYELVEASTGLVVIALAGLTSSSSRTYTESTPGFTANIGVGKKEVRLIARIYYVNSYGDKLTQQSVQNDTLLFNNLPTLTLTSPGNNQIVSAVSGRRTITISGTVSDTENDTVSISAAVNGKTKTTSVSTTSTAKSWSLTWDVATDTIAQGSYSNILVTANDGNGGISTATYTGTITVDRTNPVITVTGVTNGAKYQDSVTPTFSATDTGGSGLASVTATVNGLPYTSGTIITASGSHTLVVTATDNAGNQKQQTVTFSINKAPTLTLTSPGNNQIVSAVSGRRTITISGTVSDTENDTVSISAAVNGKTKTTSVSTTSTAKSWSLTWDVATDTIAQGSYSNILVTANDGNGGISTATYTGTITVDRTNPVITVTGVTNGAKYQDSVTPTFSATDTGGSGLASVTATVNGLPYTSGTIITASGSHTLVVTATDNAGNQKQQTVTFSINKAPTLNLTSPLENLLGTDGNCEDVNKFAFTDGNAVLDSTRKTQGTNSIKITKSASATYMAPLSSRYIKPAVDDYYLGIFDVYQGAPSSQVYVGYAYSGVTISQKSVTAVSGGFPASTTGQFVPIIRAFKVTAVSSPGTSWFYPRASHVGGADTGSFNVDSFRLYKITQAEYDALPTFVDLATAQAIAAQYPYLDPANNQTLAEGNTLPVEGTAGDTDNGNVVTVKYRINGGTARAIASGVSDGSSPISFAKNLTYSNKRLWDGSTDIVGADLAENTDHVLTVWAEDDQGGKSAEVTRIFRVIWNRPPTISGANEDLGTIMAPPSKIYSVTEPEGNPFTITEKINGTVIRSFPGVAGQQETITIPHDLWIRLDLDTPHTLTVEATDSNGLTSTRTFTFTRTETHIEFLLNFDNPAVAAHFTLDGMPKRVLVTLERYLPPGSSIESVKVCNNALDELPTWEDATAAVTAGRGYLFTNQTKTAANWRINIWVILAKGTATERVRLEGYGGAFD